MKMLSVLVLAGACAQAGAQTPPAVILPDGSSDMYLGLGLQSMPAWDGARERTVRAVPALQIQWSNGVFVSGQTVGLHLGSDPRIEFGPLLALDAGRDADGTGRWYVIPADSNSQVPVLGPPAIRLSNLSDVSPALTAGGFFNYTLAPELRLMSDWLYGAGRGHRGAQAHVRLQKSWRQLAPHHNVSIVFGATLSNRAYQQSYFGITPAESIASGITAYRPSGGWTDLHLGGHWNWALNNAWLLTSTLTLRRLQGSAADSPLSERRTSVTVATALAYRF